MSRVLVALLIAGVSLAVPHRAHAAMFSCREPMEPMCLTLSGPFGDKGTAERCRSEVQFYVSDVKNYLTCLDDAKRTTSQDATRLVGRFNCKIRGDQFCS